MRSRYSERNDDILSIYKKYEAEEFMDCDSSCWRRNTFLSCQGPCKQVMKQPHIYWSQPGYILHIFGPMAPRAKSVNRIPDGIPEEFQDCCFSWLPTALLVEQLLQRPVCNDCDLKSSWNFRRVMFTYVVVSHIFCFHPYLGKWSNLTNIFQMGWNHQLVTRYHLQYMSYASPAV